MKLKSFLAVAVTCSAVMLMSVVSHAATQIKVEGAKINSNSTGIEVPIVLETTDTDKIKSFCGAMIRVHFDNTKWKYSRTSNDVVIYYDDGGSEAAGSVAANEATPGVVSVAFTYDTGNGDVVPDENGKIKICTLRFTKEASLSEMPSVSDSDFDIGIERIESYNPGGGNNNYVLKGTEMKSFFKFDVTGDLGRNAIESIGVQVDGVDGVQELNECYSTTYTDGTDYANETTTFVVNVNTASKQTKGITIYGKKSDGDWMPLSEYIPMDDVTAYSYVY